MMKIIYSDDPRYRAYHGADANCVHDDNRQICIEKKLLDACILKQQRLIDDFSARIRSLTETAGLGNEEPYDNTELAIQAARIPEINTLNELLEFANSEMDVLTNLKMTVDVAHDKAVLGSVVVTKSDTFFICASIEGFEVDGEKYVGISTHSPVFQAMSGKSKGDTFSLKRKKYTITDIF